MTIGKNTSKRFYGKHVLMLEGYARQVIPFIREFKKYGCEVTVLCNSIFDCAYSSRLPDHKIIGTCDVHRPIDSEKYIVNLIKTSNFDLVVPSVDFSARILAKNKDELSRYSRIAVSDFDTFTALNDKLTVMQICQNNNIPCPKTLFDFNSICDIENSRISFPVVLKPRTGYGSKGFYLCNNMVELESYVKDNDLSPSDLVVQECIPGKNCTFTENLFVNSRGDILSRFTYWCAHIYPLDGGSGTFNVSVDIDDIHQICERLVRLTGASGCLGIDLMYDYRDCKFKVLEINPRISAGAQLGLLCGVNQPLELLESNFNCEESCFMSYKTDVKVRMLQTDLLWFIKSKDRFNTQPGFFCRACEQLSYWDDPLPWFSFLFRGLLNFKKELSERNQNHHF